MAHVLRPLLQWPRRHQQSGTSAAFHHLLSSSSPFFSKSYRQLLPFTSSFPFSYRSAHLRSGPLRFRDAPLTSDSTDSDDDGNSKKSRNEKKREAKRAVRWGMELANFSPSQIKRIIQVTLLEREAYDAIMLVKRLGRDVREGKRRQFNYIGRLLREVDPELMDGLIQATKDGDHDKFQDLSGSETLIIGDGDDEAAETEDEYEEQESRYQIDAVTRWFNGLINKDIDITNEIYSLQDVDFDRQELRRLVRKLYSVQEHQPNSEEKGEKLEKDVASAQRSLRRFLQGLAKQLSIE